MKHVIIGASAAGISAAKTLRKSKPEDEIIVLCREDAVHSRCMLHYYLGGDRTREQINFISEKFFDKYKIDFRPSTAVTSIDKASSKIKLENGEEISYDKLLLTTGAKAFVPPVEGFKDAKNIHVFRDIEDADRLQKIAKQHAYGDCVIVGSGLVGMDAASALAHLGIHATVVEMADRICPLQLDETAATEYQKLFEAHGTKFSLADGVVSAEQTSMGYINAINLKSGKKLVCDFVIVAAGVRANIALATEAGLKTERGIVVDDYMQTDDENIWAAGDATAIAGIWSAASLQGEVAAKNMAGIKTPLTDKFGFQNTMNFYGLSTLSVGIDISSENNPDDKVFVNKFASGYQKYVIRDGALAFALVQGDISNLGYLRELVKNKTPIAKMDKNVLNMSFADFYNYNEADGSYSWK